MKAGEFYRIGLTQFGRHYTITLASIALLLFWGAMHAQAQTNAPVNMHGFFSCPVPQIDSDAKSATKPASPVQPTLVPAPLSLETGTVQETDPLGEYMRWNGRELLVVPPPPAPGGLLSWFDQQILNPEVVRYHKAQFTGSIVSAIMRKNPLCLLHPLIFSVDW